MKIKNIREKNRKIRPTWMLYWITRLTEEDRVDVSLLHRPCV